MSILCFLAGVVGIILLSMSKYLRDIKARRDNDGTAIHGGAASGSRYYAGYISVPAIAVASFSQFEWFVILFVASNFITAVALALASFVGTTSTVFLSLIGIRSFLVYAASLHFVRIVLRSSTPPTASRTAAGPSASWRRRRRLHLIWLASLLLPVSAATAFTFYQARQSDDVRHAAEAAVAAATASSTPANAEAAQADADAAQARYVTTSTVGLALWAACWAALLVMVAVARTGFAAEARDAAARAAAAAQYEMWWVGRGPAAAAAASAPPAPHHASAAIGAVAPAVTAAPPSSPLSPTAAVGVGGGGADDRAALAVVAAVRTAVSALDWIAVAIGVFVGYTALYTLIVSFFVGTPPVTWFLTVFVNFCSPPFFSFPIFGFFIYRIAGQLRSLRAGTALHGGAASTVMEA
ncbi:hypothetical protein DFJ73DRAFT_772626 [Zopfochytrium polystomum]|nr:hypothetical protein DFJ73DRAFT_772626 [Zopfochytrium polystomum]